MSRIHEALKKAAQERSSRIFVWGLHRNCLTYQPRCVEQRFTSKSQLCLCLTIWHQNKNHPFFASRSW